jgi:alkylation response protein AidB-like acyl-CoA dehydrogenase
MDLSLSPDQVTILDALNTLARPYENVSLHQTGFALVDDALDRELANSGFLDVGFDPEMGIGTAALIVERLARLPQATEAALSAIVRPLFGDDIHGPLCIVRAGRNDRLLRFLRAGATVIIVGDDSVSTMEVTADQVRAEPEALYGYPMATLLVEPERSQLSVQSIDPATVCTHWRIAVAAEAAGLLAAALDSVCHYTSERQQFGRPLASFQGMRHRLAEAQVRTNGVYWLAMRAANSLDPADAALAALHAQESARACVYDFHQFMGAMGMTLEHPLHLWTYRLKALASELGGRGGNALAAAEALWG